MRGRPFEPVLIDKNERDENNVKRIKKRMDLVRVIGSVARAGGAFKAVRNEMRYLAGTWLVITVLCGLFGGIQQWGSPAAVASEVESQEESSLARGLIALPQVDMESSELFAVIFNRRSHRSFAEQPLQLDHLGAILWAGLGITVDGISGPTRAAPSAGATDPLRILVIARDVSDLKAGIYRYNVRDHVLEPLAMGVFNDDTASAALGQAAVRDAPAIVVLGAQYSATTARYGERGVRYVHIEAGHAGQNMVLAAQALGLGSVVIGAFHDEQLNELLADAAGADEQPLLLLPLGYRR